MLYAASALAAFAIAPDVGRAARCDLGARGGARYAVGALVAWLLVSRRVSIRARAILASAVFAAVALVPTILHADARNASVTAHVKSDVLIVEQAAESLLHGRNPYVVIHDQGSLAEWPATTKAHFPYLPAILVLGMPRAVAGPGTWTDARVIYLAITLAIAVPSILWLSASVEGRIRAFQVMLVLVSGAPLVFTSGKEVLVLSLVLASLVALQRGHTFASGASAGLAAAMHQLAWVILPMTAFMLTRGRATTGRKAAAIAASIAIAAVGPFLVWDAGAFVEDTVLFPLGFDQPVVGTTLTPGSLVAGVAPSARWVLVLVTLIAVAAYTVAVVRRGVRAASDVARAAGILLLIALLLAPRVRLAYFAFPANLLLWSRIADRRDHVCAVRASEPL